MAKEKTLVEDTFIQMKNLEEAVAENAKGILASTMKQEIKDLVKESLFEQEEEEVDDTEVEPTDDVEDTDNLEGDDEFAVDDEELTGDEFEMGDEEPIDLTGDDVTDEEVLKVFQLMGPEDEVIVTKNTDGNINLKDNSTNKEYMIVQESEDDFYGDMEEMYDDSDDMEPMDTMEDYDTEFNEYDVDSEFAEGYDQDSEFAMEEYGMYNEEDEDLEGQLNNAFAEMDEEFYSDDQDTEDGFMPESDVVYELELEDGNEEYGDFEESLYESKSFKAKGSGMGNPSKFKYSSKPNQEGGFKTVKKTANKTMGTGKAKFTYKDGENLDGEFKIKPKKKVEANEASRTLGAGRRFGKPGLDKPKAAPRHLRKESVDREVTLLREKNEEYRNALNVFRDKLNEVAVFNSNLAYATRLFTEHTTTKQEKINILKRFDSVETIKESKNLYQTIKQELNKDNSSKPINESFERTIDNSPSTGSAINLIESKTYENPQFLRMKDLMGKLK